MDKLCYVVFILLILAGCTNLSSSSPKPEVESCNYIDHALTQLDFDAQDKQSLREWIQKAYDVQPNAISESEYEGPEITHRLEWTAGSNTYSAAFRRNHLIKVEIDFDKKPPSGSDIVHCYGDPAMYGAYFYEVPMGNIFEIELWYPSEGFVVRHLRLNINEPPSTIQGDLAINDVAFVRPGTIETVVNDVYTAHLERIRTETLQTLRPWPGTWNELEITLGLHR